MAQVMLKNNKGNRAVRYTKVLQYAKDIKEGRWKSDTYEFIKISKTGKILDGQHRLIAVVKASIPVWFHVAEDCDDNIFDVLDTGTQRNACDVFTITGVKNSNVIPSVIAKYNQIRIGRKFTQIHERATNAVLLEQYFEDEEFWQYVIKGTMNYYKHFAKILSPSIIGGFYSYFLKIDNDKAEEFISQLCTGVNVNNRVMHLLRQKLMADKVSSKKMNMGTKMALIIKAWNYFIEDKEPKILKYDNEREDFPKIVEPKINYI